MVEDREFCVYRHTFPNGKVYIGITNNPDKRWDDGFGYQAQPKVFRPIVKYGWDNIKHEILMTGLSQADARIEERRLIKEACLNGKDSVYNTHEAKESRQYTQDSWLDVEINDRTAEIYFQNMTDEWVEPYTSMYWSLEYTVDHALLKLAFVDICGSIYQKVLTFCYPRTRMTFGELRDWLFSKPKPVETWIPLQEKHNKEVC